MNGMLIFLLIIVPILHKCNSTDDETQNDDVLQVAIIKDWQNKSGYEFLGKLIFPKHRFNVQIYRNTPPYIPPIGPFQADQNPDADLFYFRIEKKYKAEEFSVSIGVAKYGVSIVAQYDQFGWIRRYYFEIDSNPAYKECEEIGTVLHKTKKQIIHQFNLLRRNNKTMTEEERVENRKKRDKFMKEMSKGFAKQLKKKKTGKKNVQIAPPPPPPPTKETIGHMEKGKGKRPASSAAAQEQPQRKARIKYNEEEKAWLFWYRDHVFIYTSSKMDTRNKETDEIAEVIRRIEPRRTGYELLTWFHNHRSHKDLIVIEEEPRQKLHEAFLKKMRAEFPEKPENGASLPSIGDLSVPAPMDERT